MDSPLGVAVRKVSTSNLWTTLPGFLAKVNRHLPRPASARELATLLLSVPPVELRCHGVWVTSFGPKYMPIVLTNPAFARALACASNGCEEGITDNGEASCTCGHGVSNRDDKGADVQRYFQSSAYNAGRHCSTVSAHRANCPCWVPPSTGHLHSWRRPFEDKD